MQLIRGYTQRWCVCLALLFCVPIRLIHLIQIVQCGGDGGGSAFSACGASGVCVGGRLFHRRVAESRGLQNHLADDCFQAMGRPLGDGQSRQWLVPGSLEVVRWRRCRTLQYDVHGEEIWNREIHDVWCRHRGWIASQSWVKVNREEDE